VGTAQHARLTGLRVLVVDDSKDSADSLVLLLRMWGCEALACYDGLECLAVARASRPDVVILDLLMPKMNGLHVARHLREQADSQPPVLVAVTELTGPAVAADAEAAGFGHYLLKPADPDALRQLLSSV
jgi:CheY-like chemotaxis protein